MINIDAAAIRAHLPWPRMLEALERALRTDVHAPLRASHSIAMLDGSTSSLLMMPAWRTGQRLGVKLVTAFPGNAQVDKRSVAAVYVLFDARNGRPLAMLDGEEITARRTAGASAYAATFLARDDAQHLVMIGAGRQARGLIEAHSSICPISRVSLWSRTHAHAVAAATAMAATGLPVTVCTNLEAAVRCADIVSCATLSTTPLVLGEWLQPGTHVDLVGAFRAAMRETDDAVLQRADLIVVDDRAAALAEGGDIVQAIRSGALDPTQIVGSLGDLARGLHPGRTHRQDITVFKSVGFALEDLAAAEAVFDAVTASASTQA